MDDYQPWCFICGETQQHTYDCCFFQDKEVSYLHQEEEVDEPMFQWEPSLEALSLMRSLEDLKNQILDLYKDSSP
ncbi:MAG: hypothetical protein Q8874_02825 [Sweet potato little leaf phytoplasma]|nr:hypothetical protein [Sweet potato little leaf phytoplasma]